MRFLKTVLTVLTVALTFAMVMSISSCGPRTGDSSNNGSDSKPTESNLPPVTEIDLKATPFTNELIDEVAFEKSLIAQGDLAKIALVIEKAKRGEDIIIGTIGGSITEGMSATAKKFNYSSLLKEWFSEKFPDIEVKLVNAGIGATGSLIGVHRMQSELLDKKPDLVVVEFSANDPKGDKISQESYESVVRRILIQDNNPAVLIVFMFHQDGTSAQISHIPTGEKYNLPMISVKDSVQKSISDGKIKWADYSPDSVHPNNKGHKLIADLLTHRIQAVIDNLDKIDKSLRPLPETEVRFMNATLFNNTNLNPTSLGAFQAKEKLYPNDVLSHGWIGSKQNDPLVFETESKVVTLLFKRRVNTKGATAQVMINGIEVARLKSDFAGGFGEYADLKTVLNRDTTEKAIVEIRIVEEPGIPDGSTFMLLAVLQS